MRNVRIDQDSIRVIDGVIPPEICLELIDIFHKCESRHKEVPGRLVELDLLALKFEQDPENPLVDPDQLERVGSEFMKLMEVEGNMYRNQWDPHEMLPSHWAAEGFRVKQYRPGEHEFRIHADVGHRDSAERFLGFLFYLNDADAGTRFPQQDLEIESRAGSILIFPPMWPWPHEGLKAVARPKYVMSSYQRFAF